MGYSPYADSLLRNRYFSSIVEGITISCSLFSLRKTPCDRRLALPPTSPLAMGGRAATGVRAALIDPQFSVLISHTSHQQIAWNRHVFLCYISAINGQGNVKSSAGGRSRSQYREHRRLYRFVCGKHFCSLLAWSRKGRLLFLCFRMSYTAALTKCHKFLLSPVLMRKGGCYRLPTGEGSCRNAYF